MRTEQRWLFLIGFAITSTGMSCRAPKDSGTKTEPSSETKNDESDTDTEADPNSTEDGFAVSGTIALSLGLSGAPNVTDVVAVNTETNRKVSAAVDPEIRCLAEPIGRIEPLPT